MSPLARSLFALASLLAAAAADYEYCSKPDLVIGMQTTNVFNLNPTDVPPLGGRISITNDCYYQGATLTGSLVQACNKNPYGFAPFVTAVDPLNLVTEVDVYCPDGCPYGVTVYIQQFCK